ncbi:MAG: hypothetical protein ACK4NX_01105, partial [Candidatus Paceibacteria bacterium]
KNLAKIAFGASNLDYSLISWHGGSLALVFANENEIEIAKALTSFKKENETFDFVGGFLKKEFLPKERIAFLAKIPSREVLLTELTGILASPMQELVFVLNANLSRLLLTLKALKGRRKFGE